MKAVYKECMTTFRSGTKEMEELQRTGVRLFTPSVEDQSKKKKPLTKYVVSV